MEEVCIGPQDYVHLDPFHPAFAAAVLGFQLNPNAPMPRDLHSLVASSDVAAHATLYSPVGEVLVMHPGDSTFHTAFHQGHQLRDSESLSRVGLPAPDEYVDLKDLRLRKRAMDTLPAAIRSLYKPQRGRRYPHTSHANLITFYGEGEERVVSSLTHQLFFETDEEYTAFCASYGKRVVHHLLPFVMELTFTPPGGSVFSAEHWQAPAPAPPAQPAPAPPAQRHRGAFCEKANAAADLLVLGLGALRMEAARQGIIHDADTPAIVLATTLFNLEFNSGVSGFC